MYLRIWALLFGIGFVLAGVAGFLPMFTFDGNLFGVFEVDAMHNAVHIISGAVALIAATSYDYSKLYFQVFGIAYGLTAVLGFMWGGDLYGMHVNTADNILHLVIAIFALSLGFSAQKKEVI